MKMFAKTVRSAFALVLVAALFLGVCSSPIALAAEALDKEGPINYVSLGDSMTNGYGFEDYKQDSNDRNVYDFIAGKGVYGKGSYALQFEEHLKGKFGDVNHTMLAPSGLTPWDLLYLLDAAEEVDDGWHGWRDYVGTYGDAELKNHFQTAVTEADIITMCIGNASFGAYLVQKVTDAIGIMGNAPADTSNLTLENGLALLEDEDGDLKKIVLDIYADMKNDMTADSAVVPEGIDVDKILDVVAYTTAFFLVSYEALIDKIIEMNPDAEIILIGLMNTTYGMVITGETDGEPYEFAFGDMMDDAFAVLNAYIAAVPAKKQAAKESADVKFYYAEQPTPDFIVNAFDDLANNGWENVDGDGVIGEGRLSGAIVRQRNLDAYNNGLRSAIGAALGFALPAVSLEDVSNYEAVNDVNDSYNITAEFGAQAAQYNGANAGDLPLVERYIAETGDVYLSLAQAKAGEVFKAEIEKEISIAIYLAIEEAVVANVGTMEISVGGLMGIAGDIFSALGDMPEALDPDSNPGPVTIKNTLVEWFNGSANGRAMCKVYALFKVGNGMSVHPTPVGHDNIYEAVVKAYESKHTVDEQLEAILDGDIAAVKDVYFYLLANMYINDAQTKAIVFKVYECVADDEFDEDEQREVADFIFETLFYADITDADRIAIVGNVYSILDEHYGLCESNSNIKAVENIADYLYSNKYIDDEQAFLLVNFIYWTVSDGIQDNDIMEIVKFAYLVIFDDMRAAMFADLGDVDDPSLTSKQKLDILMTIYGEFKAANPEIVEANPELVVVEELYETLTDDTDGEALLDDDQLFAIVDTAVKSLVVDEKPMEDAVKEITSEVNTQIESLPTEKKLAVLEKVSESVDKLGQVEGGSGVGGVIGGVVGGGSGSEDSMVSMKEFTKAFGIAKDVVANLKAEGLFTGYADAQFTAITNAVIGMILNNDQLDAATLAETAFSMLFEQPGHTLEDKINIVVVIYKTLHDANLIIAGYDFFGDVDKFVAESEKLVEDLKDIILANEETVKELYADLETLNVELEVLVKDLNTKVAELNKLENEVLVNLVADRNALVAELLALEEKLVAVQNGTYGRSAVSEKDALIADTKAAIENTKAAIAELDATIAYVVNQIKTDKSGIEAIKADIAEIKANIAATETALAEVVAALDQLNADLVVLTEAVDVLYNVAIGQFVKPEDVVNAAKAIADVVPAIVENVKALYELGVEVAEKVEATVNVINENIESINAAVEALNASAEAWVDVNVDKAEAIADTLESVNAALNAFVNDNYPVVEEALKTTVDELNKALEAYVNEDVIPLWEDYKIVALAAAGMAYLYVDEKGYIEDAKNAINGYIADAEKMLEDLKPELEKAKVELEKAKAELEAKLPVWKEDLKQLKEDLLAEADAKKEAAIEKAIAEIEAKIEAAEKVVAELEAFVAEVEAHVANVEAALEAVKAALAVVDGDLLALNDALVNLVDALKDLGCSVAGLGETLVGEAEKLVGYGIMIHEDIVAVVESLSVYGDLAVRLAEVVKNDIIENKLAVLKYVAEMIKPVCEYLVKAIANAVVEYLPELDAALYDYFYNNPEEVIDFVKTYGPYLLPIVEEYGDEALAVIGFVLYMYGEDMAVYVIENHEAILAGFIAWADKYGDRTVAMLQVYAEALGLCDAVRDQIAELEAELEKLEAELEKVTGEAKEAIEAEIAKVKAEIEALNAKVEAVIDALNKVVVDANAKVEDVIEDLEAALKDLEAAVKDLENAVEDLVNETLKAIRDEIFASNRIVLEKILGIAEDILNKNITSLEELVEALDDAAVEAAKEIKAIIDELIYDATHGDYVIDNDSFYVALGDSSAVSKSYVDALAAALDVDYANLAQKGLTTSGTLALIAEQAEVLAKADLVTVGYTANMFTAEVVNTINAIMMGEEVAEYDWAALVTEEGVEYVEKALAEVHAKFVEQGLNVDFMGRNLADTLTACVEAYAYKYVEHVLTYPELVNAIHAVAPEALVVIVGMHNTVENIVIDVEGNEIALGDYIQYTVDAANVLGLVNAMLVENTVFVDAPDVETLKEAGGDDLTYDMLAFVWEVLITEGADFATSEAGHAYITEQILNALNVVDNRTGLLGDANSDGVVDSTDAMLVLQYDALIIGKEALNLVVCDVDGDGDVDSTDAMYILQYDGLLIEVFPVEE